MPYRIIFLTVGHNIYMTSSVKARLKAIIPSVLLLLLLAVFVVIAFVQPARTANATPSNTIDREAVRVLNNCRAFAASHDFETQMSGTIKARVFGIPYKITASGGRTVKDGDLESVAESVSAFVKAGVKRQVKDGKLYSSNGTYKRKRFSYSEPQEYSYNDYVSKFGKPDTGLVKYELDGNILSAEKTSDTTFRFTLEQRAAKYSGNEVKTTLGVDKPPEYELIELTLEADGDKPTRVTVHEVFTVDKFGGTRCDATYSESYTFKN